MNKICIYLGVILSIVGSCKPSPNKPTITTSEIIELDITSIKCGGKVWDDGGSPVTQRGVCWGPNPYPTINDSLTKDGGGTGEFNSVVYTLKPNTLYYLRAYAINSAGVEYGLQKTFQTNDIVLGDTFQGGLVCYINKIGDKGYIDGRISGIVCASNSDSLRSWGCIGTDIVGLTNSIGYGKINTQTISKRCSEVSIASKFCENLVMNGYADWFLPSEIELKECNVIHKYPAGVSFWTSSQQDATNAKVFMSRGNGTSVPSAWTTKDRLLRIQPVRYFITP